ncbi:hypothetical protein [Salinisphaera sp. G21_0]|uniref:hypothetical protein n=1 Tax=Salinisphaera sp. G21_0 TaxID=2821094 RepID=UPI001AD994BD|nr:hypothetical protein [Salinisphaera sp. G21_0]MBO9482251.1 hypothetical protein [Salinisphaera sp. G21_0]
MKFIILIFFTSSLSASELYRFNFYDVYATALETIDNNAKETGRSYSLYALDVSFTADKLDFVTSFLMRYEVPGESKYNYLCLKLNSGGDVVEFRNKIKPIFNNPNRPSEYCFTFGLKIKSAQKILYDIDYSLIVKTLDSLLDKRKSELAPATRIEITPLVKPVGGEPGLYFSSYYKYKKNRKTFFACQIINKHGEQVSFKEDIPEKKEKTIFPDSYVSKPTYRCKLP